MGYFDFMKEIEAKMLEVNRAKVGETLVGLGAKKIFDGDLQTFFFDSKYGAIMKAKNVLRLQKSKIKLNQTFKKVTLPKLPRSPKNTRLKFQTLELWRKSWRILGFLLPKAWRNIE